MILEQYDAYDVLADIISFFRFRESFLRLAASRFLRFPDVDTVFYLLVSIYRLFFRFRESFLRLVASRFHRFPDVDTVFYLFIYLVDEIAHTDSEGNANFGC